MSNYLITIVGPTAIGKTALSIKLAQHFNCSIVSCDSRQFFKEMEIGTAVPNQSELQAAKHYFIQNKSVTEKYSVGDFETDAIAKLEELFKENNIQIMVGGSGLYVDAVLKGLDNFPEIDTTIREKVRLNYSEFGLPYLQENLKKLDVAYYNYLESNNSQTLLNPQRMMRFVEVCIATKLPYSSFLKSDKKQRNFTSILIGLDADKEIIYDRINQRVNVMMENGLLNEVKHLTKFKELNGLQTVGYRELFGYLNNELSLDFAIEEIKKNTRRFAKRQLTWFKRTPDVVWFDYIENQNTIISYIKSKLN